jgi:hypothetical protein
LFRLIPRPLLGLLNHPATRETSVELKPPSAVVPASLDPELDALPELEPDPELDTPELEPELELDPPPELEPDPELDASELDPELDPELEPELEPAPSELEPFGCAPPSVSRGPPSPPSCAPTSQVGDGLSFEEHDGPHTATARERPTVKRARQLIAPSPEPFDRL